MTGCEHKERKSVDAAQVLGAIGELGEASLGLVCWELSLAEEDVAPLWAQLVGASLIEPGPVDKHTGERMYRLSSAGRGRLAS